MINAKTVGTTTGKYSLNRNKILLVLLPFWTPMIPPQGNSQLKVFLEKHGYKVKAEDANILPEFGEIYQRYFKRLKWVIPESNWGNFYNIGHDVLRNHMMAHFNHAIGVGNRRQYDELLKLLFYNTYFRRLDDRQVDQLDSIIEEYYNILEKYVLNLLEAAKPGVLGLTAHLGTLGSCLFSFKLTKERYPYIMTMIGGSIFSGELPVASPDFKYFLEKTPYIDKVIIGEGENLVLKLLRGEFPQSQRVFTAKDINGQKLDINSIDLPDVSDFDLERYPFNAAFVSKSCPNQCKFCSVTGFFGGYRQKSVALAVEQMAELYKKTDLQLFHMLDSLVNPFITEFTRELIRRHLSLYFDAYMRVSGEGCDPEKTFLWRRGGLYRTRLGIETGSQRLLEMMRKDITVEQAKATIKNLAHAGIKTTTYFVIGFPGETEEDFQQTLDFIEEMKDDIWEMECNPFYYYYIGQANADQWAGKRKLLYPEYARNFLISQTWVLDCHPTREERFRRMFRLTEHCKKMGIPNPYSTEEIYEADNRWKNLHENAVPGLLEFQKNHVYINENKYVKKLIIAQEAMQTEGDFLF
jgi:MoaA/NifB/PqqE/SkfB family radical SAM enzyme